MKRFAGFLMLLVASCETRPAFAASFSIDAVAAVKAVAHPSWTSARRLGMGAAFGLNNADWALTAQFTIPGGGFCEANGLLREPGEPCYVSRPRLDVAKLAVDVALIGEELGHQWMQWKARSAATAAEQLKWLRRDRNAEAIEAIANAPVVVNYAVVVKRNVQKLAAGGYLQ